MDLQHAGLRHLDVLPLRELLYRAVGMDDELLLPRRVPRRLPAVRAAPDLARDRGGRNGGVLLSQRCVQIPPWCASNKSSLPLANWVSDCWSAGYNCPPTELGSIYGACFSLLSTSTEVVVLNDIFSQETESKRPFTLAPGMPNSWQIAYPIQVRSKSGDTFDEMETSSGGGAGTVGGGSGNGSGGRLSTGAIVGIVFGALAMVGLFVLAAFFLLLRKRRAAQGPAEGPRIWPAQGYIPGYGPGYAPGYAQPGMAPQWKPPMEGVPQGPVPAVHELNPSAHVAPELHSTPALHPVNPVHEMGPNVRPPELGTGPL